MKHSISKLIREIEQCTICKKDLPHPPKPVFQFNKQSKILIIGQAPGRKVHESGIPWDDASGDRLRQWMGVTKEQFYHSGLIALMPMGFCYPGTGKSGDLPPRPECAPLWHEKGLNVMPNIKLTLLLSQSAHKYYLKEKKKESLTATVKSFKDYLPKYFPLPHPSPRNNIWLKKNPWFETNLLPELQSLTTSILV